jgi:hypothetical protein
MNYETRREISSGGTVKKHCVETCQDTRSREMLPNIENFLIKITNVYIRKPDEHRPGPYEVVFRLNQSPDDDWVQLFNNPTSYATNIHEPVINARYQEITWDANEENIKHDKHWIYDYVDDANKRYPPILQKRKAAMEASKARDKAKTEKIAELDALLKDDLRSRG